jgi:hypothetical protein
MIKYTKKELKIKNILEKYGDFHLECENEYIMFCTLNKKYEDSIDEVSLKSFLIKEFSIIFDGRIEKNEKYRLKEVLCNDLFEGSEDFVIRALFIKINVSLKDRIYLTKELIK